MLAPMTNEKPTRTPQAADKYIVRLPEGMRDRIAAAAKESNRSMNAEIVQRLAITLSSSEELNAELESAGYAVLPRLMTMEIADRAATEGASIQEMTARIFAAGMHKDAPEVLYISVQPGATVQDVRAVLEAAKGIISDVATIVSEPGRSTKKKTPKAGT
ncbi:Arc family DNA-binding protein [Massilia eurypsychrophila]|nr:Arc family DNA-binding protein [Massilia eurypsychrophila]